VRQVADDAKAPQELLQIAAQLLLKADSSLDDARLRRLREHLPADKALDRHFEQLERRRHPEYAIM
jgi:anti-sigma factor RsiW